MAEREEEAGQDGGGTITSALKSKELLIPAAVSAAGAIVAAKGPDLLHRLTDATEKKGEEQAEELGEKASEGAKRGLMSGKGGAAG